MDKFLEWVVVSLQLFGWLLLTTFCLLVCPVAGFLLWLQRDDHKTKEILSRTACPYCGGLYGMAAAHEAERAYLERCQRVRAENPHLRFRFSGVWTVWCPSCDKSCGYNSDWRKLAPTPEEQREREQKSLLQKQRMEELLLRQQNAPNERQRFGERFCAGCGGRLYAWADERAGCCALCRTPLPPGLAPPPPP